MRWISWFLVFFLLIAVVNAHQPRIVENTHTIVEEPEISKVYYGVLDGNPHYFKVENPKSIVLYVNILSPYPNGKTNYNVSITENDQLIANPTGNWTKYFEEFGNDEYYKGPEYKGFAEPGIYVIKVSNPKNTGKYALAIGKKEEFGPGDVLSAVVTMPKVKKDFFGKAPITAYNNFLGIVVTGVFIIFAFFVFLLFLLLRMYIGYK